MYNKYLIKEMKNKFLITVLTFSFFYSFNNREKTRLNLTDLKNYQEIMVVSNNNTSNFIEILDNENIVIPSNEIKIKIYGKALLYWKENSDGKYVYNDLLFSKGIIFDCEKCKTS